MNRNPRTAGVARAAICLALTSCALFRAPEIDPEAVKDREPNNSPAQAIAMSIGVGISYEVGKLSHGDAEDWYSFLAPTLGVVTVTIANVGPADAGTVGQVTIQDSLRIGKGTIPATDPGESKSSRPLTVTSGQKYFICVSSLRSTTAVYQIIVNFRSR